DDHFGSATPTPDGGFLLAVTYGKISFGNSFSDINYKVIKIDAAGEVIWDKTLVGSDDERLYSVVPSPGGGYLLAGNSESNISYNKSEKNKGVNFYRVVKIDESA